VKFNDYYNYIAHQAFANDIVNAIKAL